jgi:hypothetical protein
MEPLKVDLSAKKTEPEWLRAWDDFWLATTPKVFEWLRWAITLAAVQYIAKKTHSTAAYVVLMVGFIAMLNFYFAYFGRIRFVGFSWPASETGRRLVSTMASVLLGCGTYWLIRLIVDAIVSAQP